MSDNVLYVGIDFHKNSMDVAIAAAEQLAAKNSEERIVKKSKKRKAKSNEHRAKVKKNSKK